MIKRLESDEEILASWPVMSQLRSHLDAERYLEAARRMAQPGGFRLAALFEDGEVAAVAGYRIGESLAWGKFLYVDDLVTDERRRSGGQGGRLLAWLEAEARNAGCGQIHLDSGVQRHGAHRFYLRERMDITCYHFAKRLTPD